MCCTAELTDPCVCVWFSGLFRVAWLRPAVSTLSGCFGLRPSLRETHTWQACVSVSAWISALPVLASYHSLPSCRQMCRRLSQLCRQVHFASVAAASRPQGPSGAMATTHVGRSERDTERERKKGSRNVVAFLSTLFIILLARPIQGRLR